MLPKRCGKGTKYLLGTGIGRSISCVAVSHFLAVPQCSCERREKKFSPGVLLQLQSTSNVSRPKLNLGRETLGEDVLDDVYFDHSGIVFRPSTSGGYAYARGAGPDFR